ncbi:hypothetical protein PTKU46_85420 [Paraburkholderia terrae]|nr:hypothetical protein PTKU15_79630 [Paraburkholderia terrae]
MSASYIYEAMPVAIIADVSRSRVRLDTGWIGGLVKKEPGSTGPTACEFAERKLTWKVSEHLR